MRRSMASRWSAVLGTLMCWSSLGSAQVSNVKIMDANLHKAPDIFVGERRVQRFGMLAFQWDLTVQQIREQFENRESAGAGMVKVTSGTYVSEVNLTPAVLQAMTDQMYDDLAAALGKGREVVGIDKVQQVPSYQQVGKALPELTGKKAWAAPSWDIAARGSRSLGALATGIKMTQDDKLGSALTAECGCDALVFTTIKGFVGQKGRAKVDGVPGLWLEMGTLIDTRALVGFDQMKAAAEAKGKKVLNFNKMNHVAVVQSKVDNMRLFVPGGSEKEMAGVTPEQQSAVFLKYFVEPIQAMSRSYATQVAGALDAHYPKQ